MFIRLCASLAGRFPLVTLVCLAPLLRADTLEIPYAPDVVFRHAPLTFRVRPPQVHPLQLVTNGVTETVAPAGSGPVAEITLKPQGPFELQFRSNGDVSAPFHVITPDVPGVFTERDGFLEVDGKAAVLLPTHRLPPRLDRRWETMKLLENLLTPDKPALGQIHLLAGPESDLAGILETFQVTSNLKTVSPAPTAWFRVHGFLMELDDASRARVAVDLDLHDLERGMPLDVWFMKWQFTLQRLRQRGSMEQGWLFGPEYTSFTVAWKPVLEVRLRALAKAHGLMYVDRSMPEDVWTSRFRDRLKPMYTLP